MYIIQTSFSHALFMFKKLTFIVFWPQKAYFILLFYKGVFVNQLKVKAFYYFHKFYVPTSTLKEFCDKNTQ